MTAALQVFIVTYWPGIVAATPSLIVGLTKINTLPRWLSLALQALSFLTHRDAPGTLKLPMTIKGDGGTSPLPMLLLIFLALPTSCKTGGADGGTGPIPQTVIDCGAAAVRAIAPDIMPAVATALASGNWEHEMLVLIDKFGEAAVDCAASKVASDAARDRQAAPGDGLAAARTEHGAAWLAKRGVTLK